MINIQRGKKRCLFFYPKYIFKLAFQDYLSLYHLTNKKQKDLEEEKEDIIRNHDKAFKNRGFFHPSS